jgi:hypothetical protein
MCGRVGGGDKVGRRRAARQRPGHYIISVRRVLPVLALAVCIAAGCSRRRTEPVNPQAETMLTVENQNFLDMDVFVVRGGQRIRLGMVPGLSSRILSLRPDLVGYGTELQIEVHPIGGRGNPITETISVHPGDVIRVTIPPT